MKWFDVPYGYKKQSEEERGKVVRNTITIIWGGWEERERPRSIASKSDQRKKLKELVRSANNIFSQISQFRYR